VSDVLLARQPLLDRELRAVGYELLFRGASPQHAEVADAERATAHVALGALTELGLDRLTGSRPAWINVSREFILDGLAATLPPGRVVLEILEEQLIDGRLVSAVGELRRAGHVLALDDFVYDPDAEPLLSMVDFVKLDVRALDPDSFQAELDRVRAGGAAVVAEKVETPEELDRCQRLGCELFQGYFFCRPELVGGRSIDASRLSLLALMSALQRPDIGLRELERTIALDLGLSYRLLRYINSAFFGLRHQIRSIGQALALLGTERLRQWAALSVFASVERKPAELTVTALVRARFCELAAGPAGWPSAAELFTLGLFSLVDALMDMPMDEVLRRVPFADETRRALACHEGPGGALLESVVALERGELARAEAIAPGGTERYRAAVEWADQAAGALFQAA